MMDGMGKVVVMQSISLDGFVEGPNQEIDWHLVDEELHAHFNEVMSDVGAFLEGRVTYELMAEFWPTADQEPSNPQPVIEFARIWRDTPKYAFSRTLQHANWNTTIVRDVDPAHIEQLKTTHGDLWVGGAELAAEFLRHDLVDEFRIYVHPVVIGAGKPLFAPGTTLDLALLETRRFTNGVVLLRYARVSSVS
jgi:dihydrofolate reductase